MPKPVKKARKPVKDENEAAASAVQRVLEMGGEQPSISPEVKAYMSKIGRNGGRIGGKRRMQTMTQARRDEIALKAATVRWDKDRERKRG